MINDMNELNLDQLEEVTGGTSPRYPVGTHQNKATSGAVLNTMQNNILNKAHGPFGECSKCHSKAIMYNQTEKVYICQDCGNIME